MDSATPELPGRGKYTSANTNNNANSGSGGAIHTELMKASRQGNAASTAHSSATAAAPISSSSTFSVSYAAAPKPVSHVAESTAQTSSSNSARVIQRESPPSQSLSAPSRGTGGSTAGVPSLTAHAFAVEPSALAFLSPQGKSARRLPSSPPSSSSTAAAAAPRALAVQHERSSHALRRATFSNMAEPQMHRSRAALPDNDDDDDGDEGWQQEARSKSLKYRGPRRTAVSPAPAPASPSRSLYSDVEAAQQQQQHQQENRSSSRSPSFSSTVSEADTSFVVSDEDGSANAAPHGAARADITDTRTTRNRGNAVDEKDSAYVPAAEVEALISAALRRYEKERDAEEEAVLEQVSAEVAEQADRYSALAEAYDKVCAEATALQERLTKSEKTLEESEAALNRSRQTQQAQREAMQRLEVELYHARDAQSQQRDGEAADWAAAKHRYERRQTTLEAQLTQLREELGEKDAHISDLTGQVTRRAAEVDALRQRTTQREADVEGDYAEIHERMRRLAQNMSTMESTLQARDGVIAELQEQLAEAAAAAQRGDRSEAQKERLEEALTTTQAALQRQVDEARRRMHRLTILEQQKEALKGAVREACQSLTKAAEEQAGVAVALEDLTREVARLAASPPRRGKARSASTAAAAPAASSRSRHTRSSRSLEEHEGKTGGYSASDDEHDGVRSSRGGAPHSDDTLVYDDDDDDEQDKNVEDASDSAFRSDSEFSGGDDDALEGPASAVTSEDEEQERCFRAGASASSASSARVARRTNSSAGGTAQTEKLRGVARRNLSTPPPSRQQSPTRATSAPSHTTTVATAAATASVNKSAVIDTSTPASSVCEKESQVVRRTAQQLHHHVARAQTLLRALRRRVVSLAKQRVPSPAQSDGADSRGAAQRSVSSVPSSTPPDSRTSTGVASVRPMELVHRLEQACRYLKSELTAATAQLNDAQAECQWRTAAMKKWEDDVQAARRDVLTLEKERLAYTTEKESWELMRQELEEQLAEAQRAATAAEEERTRAAAAHEETQRELQEAAAARATAEAGLEKEAAKTARLAAKLTELTAAQTTLVDELAVVQDKYKATLTQLQSFRASEASQQQREQQERRTHTTELAELRNAVAQLRVAESGWEAERARLQRSLEHAREAHDAAEWQRSAQSADAALRADLEHTTLCTIAEIVGAPVVASGQTRSRSAAGGAEGEAKASPTEKRLFDAEEPSVEAVVVEEDGERETMNAVVRASMRQQQQQQQAKRCVTAATGVSPHATRTPSHRRLRTAGSPTTTVTTTRLASSPSAAPSPSPSAAKTPSAANTALREAAATEHLARLRRDVVAAVQRVALELAKLRAAQPQRSLPSTDAVGISTTRGREDADDSAADWFGGAAAGASPAPSHAERSSIPLMEGDGYRRGNSVAQAPHLQRPTTGSAVKSSHAAALTPSTQAQSRGSSSSRQQQRRDTSLLSCTQPYGPSVSLSAATAMSTPQRLHTLATTALSPHTAPGPTTAHVYNISPWTPLRHSQWSPAASPPAAQAKAWGELRRSPSSMDEGGLSGDSRSAARGDVDGSGSPARPPSLRAASLTR